MSTSARRGRSRAAWNRMLFDDALPRRRPSGERHSDYAKPYQVALLAQASFDVPRSW